MALQNAMRVIDGNVQGAYAPQAKNISYKNGTVEDALDGLTTGGKKAYGTAVNILTATQANPFTCTSDGVVHLKCHYTTSDWMSLFKVGWSAPMASIGGLSSNAYGAATVPVLKGDQLYTIGNHSTGEVAEFIPYVDAT